MQALIIEDDVEIANFIGKSLQEHGYETNISLNGREGLAIALKNTHDIIIIDRMLPEIDGLTIIQKIRAENNHTPTLILSALGETEDRITGLKAGGDDYLNKPFAFDELLARIEALTRRQKISQGENLTLSAHDLTLDLLKREAIRNGTKIELKGKEFGLLEYLLRHKGQIITRTMILENVWNYHFDPQTNIIDVHISRLRQKLGNIKGEPFIKTVRGIGYMINNLLND